MSTPLPAGSQITPPWWAAGQAHLRAADPIMASLIDKYPTSLLVTRGAACETLLRAVVGQQISVKAAAAIWARFEVAMGGQVLPEDMAEKMADLSDEALRAVGLSFQKIKYMRGIAAGFVQGQVRPSTWSDESDATIIDELVRLPGIGRWTAEMFLIFHLARPDVLPLDDLGLLKAYEKYYGPVRGTAALTGTKRWRKIAEATAKKGQLWAPYRSMATWYLWRSLDPEEVVY